MASSGPTSAIDSGGSRCHRTIRVRAAEAMNANGAVVCAMFSRTIVQNDRPESAERTALINTRLTSQL